MEHCAERNILYICTPFGYQAAKELDEIDVPAFKIGSGEVADPHFLKYVASFGRPMIISTGMCDEHDVDTIRRIMESADVEFAILHCLSEYPPQFSHFRLTIIGRLAAMFPGHVIGFSDHAKVNYASFAAVALGAGIIEKHFILGADIPGPDQDESVDYAGLHDLVVGCRCIKMALQGGDLKRLSEEETGVAKWAHRSVIATCDIPAGSIISRDMLTTKRPGDGILANCLDDVVGATAKINIRQNSKIRWEDIS
jgi:N-acetylneuraminate synthase